LKQSVRLTPRVKNKTIFHHEINPHPALQSTSNIERTDAGQNVSAVRRFNLWRLQFISGAAGNGRHFRHLGAEVYFQLTASQIVCLPPPREPLARTRTSSTSKPARLSRLAKALSGPADHTANTPLHVSAAYAASNPVWE